MLGVLAILCMPAAMAQPPDVAGIVSPEPGEPDLNRPAVEEQRKRFAEAEGIDEALRKRIVEYYDEALRHLQAAEDWRAKGAHLDAARTRAPKEIEALQKHLETSPPDEPLEIPEDTPLADLERQLASMETQLRSIQAEFDQRLNEPAQRADRRAAIPALITAARQRIQDSQTELAASSPADEAPELTAARRLSLRARIVAATNEIDALEREVQCYEARNPLLALLQEETKRRLTMAQRDTEMLREITTARRREEAALAAEAARLKLQEIEEINPVVRRRAVELAEKNAAFAELRTGPEGLTQKIESKTAKLTSETNRVKQLEEEYNRIIQRVKAGGLNNAVGVMLRKRKAQLPNVRRIQREIRDRRVEIAQIQLAQSELREHRLNLSDVERELNAAIRALPDHYTEEEREPVRKEVADLVQNQRTLIDALQRDYDTYLNVLFELNICQEQLAGVTRQFTAYINENILWTGGTAAPNLRTIQEGNTALRWLTSPEAWRNVPGLMIGDLANNFHINAPILALLLAWLLFWRKIQNTIETLGVEARKKKHTRFVHSLETLGLTFLAGASWPAFIAFFAWRLSVAAETVDQARATGAGLLAAAFMGFCLETLRQLLRSNGLAEAHLGWPGNRLASARRVFVMLLFVLLPASFIVYTFENQTEEFWKDSVGRFAFAAAMVAIAVALYRLLGLAREDIKDMPGGGGMLAEKQKLHRPIHLLLAGLPACLSLLAMGGYYFTALHLTYRFFWTLLLMLAVLIGTGMTRRWLELTRRAIAIKQAQALRESMKAEEEGDEVPTEAELLDRQLDLVRVDAQTQSLVRTVAGMAVLFGAWFIWADIIPAFRALDSIRLWDITVATEEIIQDEAGQTEVIIRQKLDSITASDALLALVILAIVALAVRRLPALIEIILLQRLHMGAGERYAFLAVFRYVVIALGVIFAFNTIGIGWSNVQWLVAALGLGLGFGLQEIFANFISGLIILFERPIRVGDVVTVGGVSGRVAQIRTRATIITDWDRKELVVPNKEFVTGQLVNWTLSDNIIRIVIPVGIAYGSNARHAMEILRNLAEKHPDVMADPAPQVFFIGFGDSALNFELRVFSPQMDAMMRVRHDLHLAIDDAFREAGIEIAFPQQDIHIRSGLEPLAKALERPPAASPGD